jgi:predicted MFS family arabinose efflux permease
VGMLAGDTLAGRFVPQRWRDRLSPWLRLLLAGPYLMFLTHPAFYLACIACTAASVGYAASLMLQQRLMALTPDDLAGHALGLQSSGTLAMQGAGAALAGLVAEQTGPGAAMAVMAAISVAVTLILAPGLRSGRKPAPVPATAPGT